jgi:hypothetical protein
LWLEDEGGGEIMCQFFSFVTDPVGHLAEYYHFDWEYRKANLDDDGVDSHSHICAHFALNEDKCNKYEFNPLTKKFEIDMINSERDDSEAAEKWVKRLDFKTVIEPLIVKPIVNPLGLPKVEQVTDEQIGWLKVWASVWDSVGDSVGASVWDSVGDSVGASVGDSVGASVRDLVGDLVGASVRASVRDLVWASVRDLVGDSVGASVWAYVSAFFAIDYEHDFSPAVKLWEAGLVPSFDGRTWRLHSGERAAVVFEWMPGVQE